VKNALSTVLTGLFILLFVWFVWTWGFCRFYVDPNEMAVITAKIGDTLPPGQILAEAGQKGIQADVLGEGRHFRNPILYDREIVPVSVIPPGKVGVVTSKVGNELPEGEFLAALGEKGIWRGVIGPGKYRLNPYGYKVDVIPAISIPIGYAGVITSLSGQQAPPDQFAAASQKGVRRDILQPGLYFVNPKEYKIDVLEIGVNQVSLLGKEGGEVITKGRLESQNVAMEQLQKQVLDEQKRKRLDYIAESAQSLGRRMAPAKLRTPGEQEGMDLERIKQEYLQGDTMATLGLAQFVEFPSRDGFEISLDMTVEFELKPEVIAWIFSRYGDLPAVVDKVLMPQITSISRNKGSEYRAKDFIVGEGREKFQTDLTRSLAETLADKRIIVHNALIRHVVVPMQILDPIQQASIAVEQDLTNQEKQNTAKTLAELNTELTLIDQRRQQVAEETKKIKAEVLADQEKQVAEIHATARKQVAEIEQESAAIRADTVRALEIARASSVKMVEGEKASGLQLKAKAFGDPVAYTYYQFAESLNPQIDIRILHSGTGTLWTDLEKATFGDLGGASVIEGQAK